MRLRKISVVTLLVLTLSMIALVFAPNASISTASAHNHQTKALSTKVHPLTHYSSCNAGDLKIYSSSSGTTCFDKDIWEGAYIGLGDPGNHGNIPNIYKIESGKWNARVRLYISGTGYTVSIPCYHTTTYSSAYATQVFLDSVC